MKYKKPIKIILISVWVVLVALTLLTKLDLSKVILAYSIVVGVWVFIEDAQTGLNKKKIAIWIAIIVAVFAVVSAIFMWRVGSAVGGGTTQQVSEQETSSTNFSKIPGQFPPNTISVNPDYPATTCVKLDASRTHSTVAVAGCGSPENNFIVVQQVKTPSECVGDVDQKYYSNTEKGGEFTLCMDYYWIQGSCLSMNGYDVKRVKCDDSSKPARERPLRLALDSTSISTCPSGGYAHPVRRFVVCTETQH
ncbi:MULTISPECIES: LppU/SCO3897 family protein [Mycobacteroides]|uniref:LppU/SCO3897 family protein n=1 Tax=Mycobacteroides TaxID=670516 RepID=UPI0009273906|nr:hypothetical protein [Mycobacteroides abscessus]SHT25625.1 Putative liporotein LppU [Mycobacteroides abscessus subsp. abscessus]SHW69190.1 Putative liporotein LppU [Mycobacteroides abscessus subsp. abscessus]SHY71131.1 Putative liporotein LppU [Mycobacteroides abscessus subsp. abscessus]SHZ43899.1 Putative liporotein LppU [Mycobacteroides abscessus subsp. abscessus]SKR90629.1 Putative liporotein LppU [Mycobacteroides abscessus subsp. abscessus]